MTQRKLSPKPDPLDLAHRCRGRAAYVAVTTPDGFRLGIAVEGEAGYYPTDYPMAPSWATAQSWARDFNLDLGHSPQEAFAIVATTLRRNV